MKTPYIKTVDAVTDGLYVFSKFITVETPGEYTVNLFTTGRYILTVDGYCICEGPCKSHQNVRYYDTVKLVLSPGKHRVEITVLHVGLSNQWRLTSVFKAAKPYVIFRAVNGNAVFRSDSTWRCVRKDGYCLKHHSWNIPGEDMDFSLGETEYDITEGESFDFDLGTQTDTGVDRSEGLCPRPIPLLFPGEEVRFSVVKQGKDFVELDAGTYVTAKVALSFAANTTARVTFAECYEKDGGKGLRDDSTGVLNGWTDTVKTAEATVWEPFWFKAFRFVRIETENIENFKRIRANRWNYPMEQTADFTCSDDTLNRMYQVSANTLRCCSFETFVDCPYYEQEQYIMDSTIESAALLKYTGDTALVRKCITEFAASQTADGALLSSYPDDYQQIIPGFGLYWVFLLYDYLEYSADFDFARQFAGTMDKLLWSFENRLSKEGLIEKSIWWDFADWVPGWKQGVPVSEADGPITLYNLYYACALKKAAHISQKIGRNGLAEEYLTRYARTCSAIKAHCLDADGYYCDSRSGTGRSVHCAIWAILAGLEDSSYGEKMMAALGNPAFGQPSFCMTFYLFRALEACGMTDRIFDHMQGWQKMLNLHCTTWCENPDNPRSECHGWSSAPLYECATNVLGVRTGFAEEIFIRPAAINLDWAKGTVYTRYGKVTVEREGNTIRITAPADVQKRVILPNGAEHCFTAETAEFS